MTKIKELFKGLLSLLLVAAIFLPTLSACGSEDTKTFKPLDQQEQDEYIEEEPQKNQGITELAWMTDYTLENFNIRFNNLKSGSEYCRTGVDYGDWCNYSNAGTLLVIESEITNISNESQSISWFSDIDEAYFYINGSLKYDTNIVRYNAKNDKISGDLSPMETNDLVFVADVPNSVLTSDSTIEFHIAGASLKVK